MVAIRFRQSYRTSLAQQMHEKLSRHHDQQSLTC